MAPGKRTMPTIVLLLLGSISTNVSGNITQNPSSGIFLEGSDVTLSCIVHDNDNVIWDDLSDATSIFVGKEKNTGKRKYDNFEISSDDEDFSLIIKDVQLSDEGTYVCKDRDQLANATVTIGVLPTLHLYVKQSEATQASQTSAEVNITCSAYNARPAVSVFELSVIGSEKTVNITNDKPNQNEDGKTYNSSASVPYTMSSEEMSVCCRIFRDGQSLEHTENFNIPRCKITISRNEIRCLCNANPPVNTYYIDVNGKKQDGDVLVIEEDHPMNIRCFATNALGTGQSDLLFPDDIHGFGIVPLAVIVSVFVLLVVLTVIMYIGCRLCLRETKSDEEQSKVHGLNEEESVSLMSQLKTKPDEKEQQEDAKVLPDKNEEDTKKNIYGREHIPSDKINDVNGEMSERKSTNDEEASSSSPKPDSSLPRGDLTGDLKEMPNEFQQYKVEVSATISIEWDIFAIDALGLEVKDVLNIINGKYFDKDKVSEVWHLWEKQDDSNNTKQKLIETITKNSKDFASVLKLNVDNRNNITRMTSIQQQSDDSIAEDLPQRDLGTMNKLLSEIITVCGDLIGIVGAKQMHRFYFHSEKESPLGAKQISVTPGVDILNHLIVKGKLLPTYHSFTYLTTMLRACHIYRAENALCAYLDTTGLTKLQKEWLTFASSSVNQDWEIFGYEQLGLMDNEMLNIIMVTDDIQKQVVMAFKKWIDKSKFKNSVTVKTLMDVLSKSKPFDIHASYPGGTAANLKPTLTSPFSIVLSALDHLIGNEGQARLSQSYSQTQACRINVFEYLRQTGRLEDNQQMLAELCKKLKECHLLRAWNRLQSYTKSKTYENLLLNISRGLECDWELFAMKDLNLREANVCYIITHGNTVEAQIRSALDLWSKQNRCKEYESLLKIVINSPVCKDTKHNSCWRKMSGDQGANTESAVDGQHTKDRNCERSQNSDDVFNEMIQSVSVMIGNTGAFYLLQKYNDGWDQNEVKEKYDRFFRKKVFDGEILIKYLIESGRLSDNTESLKTFRIRLTGANLYRVRNKLDEYISQQPNKERKMCYLGEPHRNLKR